MMSAPGATADLLLAGVTAAGCTARADNARKRLLEAGPSDADGPPPLLLPGQAGGHERCVGLTQSQHLAQEGACVHLD